VQRQNGLLDGRERPGPQQVCERNLDQRRGIAFRAKAADRGSIRQNHGHLLVPEVHHQDSIPQAIERDVCQRT
jgi:hypothetical protein